MNTNNKTEKPSHTPGPWEMRRQMVSPTGTRNLYGVGPVQDGAVWFVAENVSEGDARLIAAAPTMDAFIRDCAAGKYGTEDGLLNAAAAILRATEAK